MDCKKYQEIHDHTDNGECLMIEWVGVPQEFIDARYSKEFARRERAVQNRGHKAYLKLLKQQRKERTLANVSPF